MTNDIMSNDRRSFLGAAAAAAALGIAGAGTCQAHAQAGQKTFPARPSPP